MTRRVQAIAFDVLETLFGLEPLRQRLREIGLPGEALELWFTRVLRDGFALSAAGGHRPFAGVAGAALDAIADGPLTEERTRHLLAGFGELDPHPDVESALRSAREAGLHVRRLGLLALE